jgi:hypothetical protein
MFVVSSPEGHKALKLTGPVTLTLGPMWCTRGPVTPHQDAKYVEVPAGYPGCSTQRRLPFTVHAPWQAAG